MKKILFTWMFIFLILTSCGKIKLGSDPIISTPAPTNVPSTLNERVTEYDNKEIPIQSYLDGTITGSGLYHHSAIAPPESTSGTDYSMSGFSSAGAQICSSDGLSNGSCNLVSCNSGYHQNGNTCESNTIVCSNSTGSGTQTWNGSSYGACTVTSCSSDAYLSGNTCQLYCPNPLLVHAIVLGLHVCL